jgi:thiol-disulfide isomerase/thioredoxin
MLLAVLAAASLCAAALPPERPETTLVVFWGVGCPHCEAARPFVESLAREEPGLRVEWVEARADPAGRARLRAEAERLKLAPVGVPTFVVGDRAVVGFERGVTEPALRALVGARGRDVADASAPLRLPWVGRVEPARFPLPLLTVTIGLLDGVNPCAMYVLVVLLGVLLHAGSRGRVVLYGAVFVAASGIVYVLFMTAWLGLFAAAGLSRGITMALGAVLLLMGALNLKDALFFQRGPSLGIPDAAKPGVFRRMRAVAGAASAPAALLGVVALAFLVNLVELGCTAGLPAVYTRILSLRGGLSTGARAAYLGLYGLAYVVPLALIVAVFAVTFRRFTLGERTARVLKAVSGTLLFGFGVVFLLWPGLLG